MVAVVVWEGVKMGLMVTNWTKASSRVPERVRLTDCEIHNYGFISSTGKEDSNNVFSV